MKKKLLSIVLVTVLAISFVACGQSKEAEKNGRESQISASETETAEKEKNDNEQTSSSEDELVAKSQAEFDSDVVIKVGDNEPGYFIWKVADEKGFLDEEFSEDNICHQLVDCATKEFIWQNVWQMFLQRLVPLLFIWH